MFPKRPAAALSGRPDGIAPARSELRKGLHAASNFLESGESPSDMVDPLRAFSAINYLS